MNSQLTINHYVDKANSFIDSVKNTESTYYVYTARPQPWTNAAGGADDTAVEVVNNSVNQVELDVYRDLLYGKLISNTDVIHVVPRYTWTTNTVYANYDQRDANLYSKNFYVVTTDNNDQYNVFKCIDNNGNTSSIVKPSLQSTTGTFKTGDGYTWKYMYTVDVTANTKFTSANFIPVISNTNIIVGAVPGTIDVLRLVNNGIGYSVYETGFLESIIDNNSIKLPDNSSALNNYYANSSIYLKSGFGAGQVREISSYIGSTKTAILSSPVDSYLRLDFANSSLITGGTVGESVKQIIDTLSFTSSVGYFNINDTIVQTDTGIVASVLTANTTALRVSRLNKSQQLLIDDPFRNVNDSGTVKTDKANISNSSALTLSVVLTNGSGYTSNTTVTITSNTGSSATANAQANSTGKITAINITNAGNNYITEPSVIVATPVAQTFNSNTAVTGGTGEGSNNVITLSSAGAFVQGDQIRYSVNAGNTVITGLSNNTTYFIQFANATTIALSNTSNTAAGNRLPLTPGLNQTGHVLQGISAIARILPRALYATNAASGATFTSDYSNNDFIRIGENANSNIRKIESVNSTVIVVNKGFVNTISSANTFKISTAALPTSIVVQQANGIISNTNLDSITIAITNTSVNGAFFIIGEKVKLVDSSNASLNANGTVAYSNSSALFISSIQGTWLVNQRVRGDSSALISDISTIDSRPNITVKNPIGDFVIGQLVDFVTPAGGNSGIAQLIGSVDLSENSIEYYIGPTVKITGDGTGAIAIADVNTSIGSSNSISRITVINPGSGYTYANVQVYANTLYGSNAVISPVISPINGHGSDPVRELGGRYAAISTKFNALSSESWYYPSTVSFRKIGILNTPEFANTTLTVSNFTRVQLGLSSQTGIWTENEVVVQNTSNATGIVVSGNSTVLQLKDVRGTFVQSNTLYAYSSGSTANVVSVATKTFVSNETITQANTGARARVVSSQSNTVYLTDVIGQFANGMVISGSTSNAQATITQIKTSDGTKDITTTFANRFNQTSRITLSSVTGSFQTFEYVVQANTNAKGRVINKTSDIDLTISLTSGNFSVGDTVTNSNTSANGKVTFANTSYIKVTSVSNSTSFSGNNVIVNGIGANATIQQVRSVLILSDIEGNNFQVGASSITGQNSAAQGIVSLTTNPDLIRNSGKVIYTEASNSVIYRTTSTTEEIRLIIKF
jgi:hypothetical protein